jgi:hypothetical protein
MFITLLFAAAFMLFIASRKIPRIQIEGIFLIFTGCLTFSWRTAFSYAIIRKVTGNTGPGFDKFNQHVVCIIFALILTAVFTAVLYVIAKLWSRELFIASEEGPKNEKRAKDLVITASIITCLTALWLASVSFMNFDGNTTYILELMNHAGRDFLFTKSYGHVGMSEQNYQILRIYSTVYVLLPFALAILNIILINRKNFKFKELAGKNESVSKNTFLNISQITSLTGIALFMTGAQTGYRQALESRRASYSAPHYFSMYFGSYYKPSGKFGNDIRVGFWMFTAALLALGIVMLITSLIKMAAQKKIKHYLFSFIFSAAMIISSCIFIVLLYQDWVIFHNIK